MTETVVRRATSQVEGLAFTLGRPALRSLVNLLLGIGAALAALHLLVTVVAPGAAWGPLARLADLDDDASAGSWFSSLQYVAMAVVLVLAARDRARPSALPRTLLMTAAAIAGYLGVDEMFRIHERITELAERRGIGPLQAVMINGHGAWMALYALVALVLVVAGRRHLRTLWRGYRPELRAGMAGLGLLLAGEVVFEVVGYLTSPDRLAGAGYQALVAAEEWVAMAGASLVLYSVLLVSARAQAITAEEAERP